MYQELLKGFVYYDHLGDRLIHLAEQARVFTQFDALSEVALILSNLPIERYRIIGQYYLALSICRDGRGNLEEAAPIFEMVTSDAPLRYRAEAMLSLSAISWVRQESDEAARHYLEVTKFGHFSTTIKALKAIALLKGKEGYHQSALDDLRKLYPMFKLASPHAYFDFLNSYALELSETAQLQEAKNIATLVCNSPFGPYETAWQKTLSGINQKLYKSRSTVSVAIPKPQPEPVAEPVAEPEPETSMARVIKFPKAKAVEFQGVEVPTLTPIEWLAVLLKTMFRGRVTDEEINRLCTVYFELIQNWDSQQ